MAINDDENRGFRKRFQKWSLLKTHRFENVVSSMDRRKRRLLKTVTRKASYAVISISVFVRFSVDDRRKRNKKYAFSNEDELAWIGENKSKNASVVKNILFRLRILIT